MAITTQWRLFLLAVLLDERLSTSAASPGMLDRSGPPSPQMITPSAPLSLAHKLAVCMHLRSSGGLHEDRATEDYEYM